MSALFNSSYTSNNDVPVVEAARGYGFEIDGDSLAIRESFEDQLAVVQAIHGVEMEEINLQSTVRQLTESGATPEEIQTQTAELQAVIESKLGSVWASIKKFFKDLWAKVKGFFQSIMRSFDALFLSGKKFVSKYKSQINGIKQKLSGFEYEMFDYTNMDADVKVEIPETAKFEDILNTITAATDGGRLEGYSKMIDEFDSDEAAKFIRGEVVGKSNLTSEEYNEALFAYFRGGATSKDERKTKSVDINSIIADLEKTTPKGILKKSETDVDTKFKKAIAAVEKVEKKFEGLSAGADGNYNAGTKDAPKNISAAARDTAVKAARNLSKTVSISQDVQLKFIKAYRTAWAERDRVYKGVINAAFSYAAKNGKK